MKILKEILDEIALSEPEYYEIVKRLGREPNHVELGMFGADVALDFTGEILAVGAVGQDGSFRRPRSRRRVIHDPARP